MKIGRFTQKTARKRLVGNRSLRFQMLEARTLLAGDFGSLFGDLVIPPVNVDLDQAFGGIWLEDRLELYGRDSGAPAIQDFDPVSGTALPVSFFTKLNPDGNQDAYQGTIFDATILDDGSLMHIGDSDGYFYAAEHAAWLSNATYWTAPDEPHALISAFRYFNGVYEVSADGTWIALRSYETVGSDTWNRVPGPMGTENQTFLRDLSSDAQYVLGTRLLSRDEFGFYDIVDINGFDYSQVHDTQPTWWAIELAPDGQYYLAGEYFDLNTFTSRAAFWDITGKFLGTVGQTASTFRGFAVVEGELVAAVNVESETGLIEGVLVRMGDMQTVSVERLIGVPGSFAGGGVGNDLISTDGRLGFHLQGENGAFLAAVSTHPMLSLSVGQNIAYESDPKPATFLVSLSQPAGQSLEIQYAVSGTAQSGSDFETLSGTLSIPAGELAGEIELSAIQDGLVESDETVVVTLTGGDGYELGSQVTQTITLRDPGWDWGDAPSAVQSGLAASYPTLASQDGARHQVGQLHFGENVTAEADGVPAADAVGDADGGVRIATGLLTDSNATTTGAVSVSASQAGFIDAWIDWNQDGDWDDAGEQVLQSFLVDQGMNLLPIIVPSNASPGDTYARFRISNTGGLSSTGPAADGEVQDIKLAVISAADQPIIEIDEADYANWIVGWDNERVAFRANADVVFEVPISGIGGLRFLNGDGQVVKQVLASEMSLTGEVDFRTPTGVTFVPEGPSQVIELQAASGVALRGVNTVDLRAGSHELIVDETSLNEVSPSSTLHVVVDADDTLSGADNFLYVGAALIPEGVVHEFAVQGTRLLVQGPGVLTNPLNRFDVNHQLSTTASDALAIINELRSRRYSEADGSILGPGSMDLGELQFFDVNLDGRISALDALNVINELARLRAAGPNESELVDSVIVPRAMSRDRDQYEQADEMASVSEIALPADITTFAHDIALGQLFDALPNRERLASRESSRSLQTWLQQDPIENMLLSSRPAF